GAGIDLDRLRRTVWIPQLLVAAGRALRPMGNVVLADGGAHQVEACDVVGQIGAEAGGDRFGDLDRGELDPALPKAVLHQRRFRDRARLRAIEETLDLAVTDHPVGQTGPAGVLEGLEHRSHQWERARWLRQQPRRLAGDVLPVYFGDPADDIAPVEHPLQPLLDLVGRIAFRELAHQGLRALAVLSDRFHQRAIEFAVQKEFSMLGIEADSRRRQDIGGKIRRELQDILAGLLRRAAIAFGGHRVSTRDCLASWERRRIANVRLPAVCTGSRASIFRPGWKYKASKPLSPDAPQAYTWNWPGRWSIPARRTSIAMRNQRASPLSRGGNSPRIYSTGQQRSRRNRNRGKNGNRNRGNRNHGSRHSDSRVPSAGSRCCRFPCRRGGTWRG